MAFTKIFRSTHAGAPTLTGEAGSLQALLDAVLVNGYNAKTITITRSGATATASCVGHGFESEQVLAISGADQPEYTGEFRISVNDADTFTFEVSGTPATPATGTITAKVAPIGWATAFSSGNDRSYEAPAGANSFYLNVSDHTTANIFRLRVFSSVTGPGAAVSNGTSPVPTDAQFSGGCYAFSSSVTGATARAWRVVGGSRGFGVYIDVAGSKSYMGGFFYTDLLGDDADSSHSMLCGQASGYTSAWLGEASSVLNPTNSYMWATNGRAGATGPVEVAPFASGFSSSTLGVTAYGPSAAFGMGVSRVRVYEPNAGIWAYIPGLWAMQNANSEFSDGDVFQGAAGGSLSGRSFEIVRMQNTCCLALETSDTVH